jgi:hypothetical protein
MSKPKVHMRDIRLFNNAGMQFPVCQAGAALLDCDKGHWQITTNEAEVTCKLCPARYRKYYPWANGFRKGTS